MFALARMRLSEAKVHGDLPAGISPTSPRFHFDDRASGNSILDQRVNQAVDLFVQVWRRSICYPSRDLGLLPLGGNPPNNAVIVRSVGKHVSRPKVAGENIAPANARLTQMTVNVGNLFHRPIRLGNPDRIVGANEKAPFGVERNTFGSLKLLDEYFRFHRELNF